MSTHILLISALILFIIYVIRFVYRVRKPGLLKGETDVIDIPQHKGRAVEKGYSYGPHSPYGNDNPSGSTGNRN
jgi:hypothetical protein